MKFARLLALLAGIGLAGCQYSYGVKLEPGTGSASSEPAHEFISPIYLFPDEKRLPLGQLSHLTFYENNQQGLFDDTWKSSRIRFGFGPDSGVELIPGSVKIEHTDLNGRVFRIGRVESLLDDCAGTAGCRGTYTLRYENRLPKQILEHISFTAILNGEEIHVQKTFALDYAYHGSFWDALMGI